MKIIEKNLIIMELAIKLQLQARSKKFKECKQVFLSIKKSRELGDSF